VCTGIANGISTEMKLEEAASILGVSLEDITVDGLKQTYKKLALTWDAEKVGWLSNIPAYVIMISLYPFLT
jgi:hypothetical protein